jgi:glycosyltransferase involved in cell wall biosynthesis
MSKLISVICPARNEVDSVIELTEAIRQIRQETAKNFHGDLTLEFIIIDNASNDDTLVNVQQKLLNEPGIRIIKHVRNLGLQNSILTGLRHSKGDAAVVLQFDLQDPPVLIQEMLRRWRMGELYITTQIKKRNSGFLDSAARRLGYIFVNLLAGVKVLPNSGDFWLIDRKIINQINSFEVARPFFRTLIPSLIPASSVISYDRKPRVRGKSNFNFMGKYEFFLDAILSDIRRISLLTFILSGFTFLISLVFVILKVIGFSISIWGIVFVWFSSVFFFLQGMSVEIVWRLYSDSPLRFDAYDRNIQIIRES